MEEIENDDVDKILRIFSNDDERLQKVGQILSTPKSRKIYGLLIDNELNAKEIGKIIDNDDNPRLPNLIFHLDKMVDVGLLTVEKRMQRKNGHILKYYKAIPLILIVPPKNLEKAKNSKTLKNTFRTVFKLTGIASVGIFSTIMTKIMFEHVDEYGAIQHNSFFSFNEILLSVFISVSIVTSVFLLKKIKKKSV